MTDVDARELTQVGPYRVIRLLGAGGMGRVYLAASASGRAVAVKVVRPELAGNADFRQRFRAEVNAAKAVSGAFTTPVVDADPDGPLPWLATAYVAGPSLQTAIQDYGPMPEPTLRVLGAGLAEALVAIHRSGIVHRDLKPSNILLAADGPRVIDFGISKAVDGTALTAEGQVVGSAGYMSPEHVAGGGALGPASDVFSLGAVLAFAATGRPPFGTGPFHVLMFRARHEAPQLDGVPPALVSLIAACMHKDPAQRPAAEQLPGLLGGVAGAAAGGVAGGAAGGVAGGAAPGWLPRPLENELLTMQEHLRTLVLTQAEAPPSPLLKRRSVLLGGGAVVAAAAVAGGTTVLLRSVGGGSGSGSGGKAAVTPAAGWTADLPGASMAPAGMAGNVLVCAGRSGAAGFDIATGKQVWSIDGGQNSVIRPYQQRVFAVRNDGKLHALDARTGKELWATEVEGERAPQIEQLSPAVLVATVGDTRLFGIDAATGQRRWVHAPPSDRFLSETVTQGGLLLRVDSGGGVASFEQFQKTGDINSHRSGSFYALDLNKGTVSWSQQGGDAALYAPPNGNALYAFDAQMNLQSLNPSTGTPVWSKPSGLAVSTLPMYSDSLSLVEGTLYCYPLTIMQGVKTGLVAAFDPANGRPLWKVTAAGRTGYSFAVSGRTLAFADTALHGLDNRTGKVMWTADPKLGKLDLAGPAGDLIMAGSANALYGLDTRTGRQVWQQAVTGGAAQAGQASWGVMRVPGQLFATFGSKLFAYRLPGVPPPA
ncbi:PQQ-binding-like beta-propeller repeat protein [Actinomadura barringtoniae]|uniref:PQQ-binding-like beta-propeller repeat protein n=1 Tax=Actinomadura barringtoniae TaxID=1427535 RepID=A0A939T732_9ACTN|nr:serine/threonine-protein kinase [Actinomadura barringtoniae]MBO2455631.1 PQQ-binding-like beta-propeller repeat protein [Actinomadura barringtoniae]